MAYLPVLFIFPTIKNAKQQFIIIANTIHLKILEILRLQNGKKN